MADSDETVIWPVEAVPDSGKLFMRIHKRFVDDNEVAPNAFRDHEGGMSTDWEKYASAEQTRARARTPNDNGVISMVAGEVRRIPGQSIKHAPQPANRAHTEVIGEKDRKKNPEARIMFSRIWKWEIRL